MPYVMVPVPEEIEDQVKAIIGQLALIDSLSDWDPDTLRAFVSQSSETEQALLDELVLASEQNVRLTRQQLLQRMDLPDIDVDPIIIGLNRRASEAGNPWIVMVIRGEETEASWGSELVYVLTKVAETIASVR